ncbi:MAG: hypothetical protein KKI02_06490 [Planctomycetes bacterium]|nr:hypothetical protein [Planctomycetota bacterium]
MDATAISEPVVNKTRKRRRQYIINPAFQWKFAIWIMLDVFAVCVLLALVLFGAMERNVRWRVLNPDTPHTGETVLLIIGFAAGFAVVAAAGLGLWSIIITHRFCGPLFVVGRCLDEMVAGRLPDWRPLRKRDEFKDFYALFWRMVDSVKTGKRAQLTALTETLEVVKSAANADDKARRNACDLVAARLEAMRAETVDALGDELDDVPDRSPSDSGSTSMPVSACAGASGLN